MCSWNDIAGLVPQHIIDMDLLPALLFQDSLALLITCFSYKIGMPKVDTSLFL
jgi:hypothetical protein